MKDTKNVFHQQINSPIGTLNAIADHEALLYLGFQDQSRADQILPKIIEQAKIINSSNSLIDQLRKELILYFSGKIRVFETPSLGKGTAFQKIVLKKVQEIPYGATISYGNLAKSLNRPTASRAVASANARNPLSIIVPCHRVIAANEKLGGYAGGLKRKAWLLALEAQYA